MSTTSIKLTDEIKNRVAAVAAEKGVTPHAFMVEAIVTAATCAEQRAQFVADAQAARESMLKTGRGLNADEVHAFLRARASGQKAPQPKLKPWRR